MTAIKIGPLDHGRRMSLEDFDLAEGQPGHLYELSRGVVTVVDVPNWKRLAQVDSARLQFDGYRIRHPKRIYTIASGGECKILLADLNSERHPDLAIYKSRPMEEEDIWATWVPEIVIEVVSLGSELRDYQENAKNICALGFPSTGSSMRNAGRCWSCAAHGADGSNARFVRRRFIKRGCCLVLNSPAP